MQNESEQTDHFEKTLEIVLLSIMAIVIYIGGILFLGKPMAHRMPWYFSYIGPFMVLGFDFIWIIGIKSLKIKSIQTKIIKKIQRLLE